MMKRYGLNIAKVVSLYFVVLFFGAFNVAFGQQMSPDFYRSQNIYRSPIRLILNKISITATSGMTFTNYKHDLTNFSFLQNQESQFLISKDSLGNEIGIKNWLNNPTSESFSLYPNSFQLKEDSTEFGFKSYSRGIPFSLQLHYQYKPFRIGIGFFYEHQFIKPLEPTNNFENQVLNYEPDIKSANYYKWYLFGGYRFYQFWSYDFVFEAQVGLVRAGSNFNADLIKRSAFGNFGISIEKNLSEYFRIIFKPSYDLKFYKINLPNGEQLKHNYSGFCAQIGVSINIPEIPRSPMKSDKVQLKHIYTNPKTGKRKEVRGQPFWKVQSPKVGQNHRKLWRYKWRNKFKKNPY